jgi:hypothetical protein
VTEAWETGRHCRPEQELDAVAIGDVRAMDLGHEHQTLRVYQQMALSSFDLLGPYSIAALFAAYARGLDRLAIHDGCAGLRISTQADPHALA